MSDTENAFTPSTEQVRSHYVFDQTDRWDGARGEAFDRWLAAHDREVAAQALEAFADKWAEQDGIEALMFAHDDVSAVQLTEKVLLKRAAAIRNDPERRRRMSDTEKAEF